VHDSLYDERRGGRRREEVVQVRMRVGERAKFGAGCEVVHFCKVGEHLCQLFVLVLVLLVGGGLSGGAAAGKGEGGQ
jgi:hypothetical protein